MALVNEGMMSIDAFHSIAHIKVTFIYWMHVCA